MTPTKFNNSFLESREWKIVRNSCEILFVVMSMEKLMLEFIGV